MTRRFRPWLSCLPALLVTELALAQAPPLRARTPPRNVPQTPAAPAESETPDPPGAQGPLPETMDAIAKAVDTPYRPKPGGHQIKFNLQDADLAELVNHISGLTGRRFIYGPKVRQVKVTVVSPSPVTLNEAYEAFLSILAANGMTVVPHGRFLKIVDTAGVAGEGTPVYSRGAPVPNTDRYVTRLYRLRNASPTELSQLLVKFKSKEGDISVYEPGHLLIMTDTGSNIQRMVRIVEEVDVGSEGARMWIEPIHYGTSSEIAKQINEIFELGGPGGGKNAGGLVRVIADEQTNSLIVVGTEDSYMKLLELLRRIDTAPAAHGRIHVHELQHAVAEELAQVLTQMLSGAGGQRGQQQPGASADMFEGEVRVTADKATNSLVVTSSGRDFAQLRLIIERLDLPRRQVFIEAVIMDVSVDRSNSLGIAYHGGFTQDIGGDGDTVFLAGFEPIKSVAPSATELQGLALGARGPDLPGTTSIIPALPAGTSIPAFGVVVNALASSGDANILATPHIIATDNVTAEINVGENIPLQTNFAGGSALGNLAGLGGAQAGGGANPFAALGALGGLGGFGGGFGNAQRQDVGTKIKVTPHINDEFQVRLEIEQEISAGGAPSGALGAVTITKRTANTTVVVDDQQTIVIGGLMRDSLEKTKTKIPVLGDLPVLGFLFRRSENRTRKTNLLLILTPYVIRDQSDLRAVFERKMQERQEFLDRYFVFNADWEPPKDFTRTNGLIEDIRQAYLELEVQRALEAELAPKEAQEHVPGAAIDLPGSVRVGATQQAATSAPAAAPQAAPAQQQQQQQRQRRRRRNRNRNPNTPPQPPQIRTPPQGAVSPIQINPVARSLNVERVE